MLLQRKYERRAASSYCPIGWGVGEVGEGSSSTRKRKLGDIRAARSATFNPCSTVKAFEVAKVTEAISVSISAAVVGRRHACGRKPSRTLRAQVAPCATRSH